MHEYPGMDLDYSMGGKVQVSMIKYVDKVLRDFPEQIRKTSSTPAADHLFTIRDPEETKKEGKWLSEEQVQHFYHAIAQLLFLSVSEIFRLQCLLGPQELENQMRSIRES